MANAKVNGRREFTREFEVAAVKLVTEQGYSVAEAARQLGVRENLLRRWKAQLATQGAKAFSGHGVPVVLDDELARLRAENKRLATERDTLKKATALFARESLRGTPSRAGTRRSSPSRSCARCCASRPRGTTTRSTGRCR